MIHPGFAPNHPANQDDRHCSPQVFFLFWRNAWFVILLSLWPQNVNFCAARSYHPAIIPGDAAHCVGESHHPIIILPFGTVVISKRQSSYRHPIVFGNIQPKGVWPRNLQIKSFQMPIILPGRMKGSQSS